MADFDWHLGVDWLTNFFGYGGALFNWGLDWHLEGNFLAVCDRLSDTFCLWDVNTDSLAGCDGRGCASCLRHCNINGVAGGDWLRGTLGLGDGEVDTDTAGDWFWHTLGLWDFNADGVAGCYWFGVTYLVCHISYNSGTFWSWHLDTVRDVGTIGNRHTVRNIDTPWDLNTMWHRDTAGNIGADLFYITNRPVHLDTLWNSYTLWNSHTEGLIPTLGDSNAGWNIHTDWNFNALGNNLALRYHNLSWNLHCHFLALFSGDGFADRSWGRNRSEKKSRLLKASICTAIEAAQAMIWTVSVTLARTPAVGDNSGTFFCRSIVGLRWTVPCSIGGCQVGEIRAGIGIRLTLPTWMDIGSRQKPIAKTNGSNRVEWGNRNRGNNWRIGRSGW